MGVKPMTHAVNTFTESSLMLLEYHNQFTIIMLIEGKVYKKHFSNDKLKAYSEYERDVELMTLLEKALKEKTALN